MNVSECMSTDVRTCSPDTSLRDAARTMKEIDAGFLPIAEADRLIGMVTDRDMAVRGLAQGLGPGTAVREVMTPETCYCYADEDVEDVARQMGDMQVRRMPVMDRNKRLVGVVSLGDISRMDAEGSNCSGRALSEIAQPGGIHSQH